MPSILNPHGLKTTPTTKFGTRELATLVIARSTGTWTNETDADSDYSKVGRALQTRAEVYGIFTANSTNRFTALVSADTLAQDKDTTDVANDGISNIALLNAELSEITGLTITVYNARIQDTNVFYDNC